MNKPEAIFYDLDNTLYPQSEDIAQRIDHCVKTFSLGDPVAIKSFWINEWLKNGPAKGDIIDKVIKKFSLGTDKEKLLKAYRSCVTSLSLGDEVRDFLIRNKNGGIKQFLITNGNPETQSKKIDSLRLKTIFDEIVVATGEHSKPSSFWFVELINKYEVDPSSSLSIGDWYAVDGIASESAGISFLYMEGGPVKEKAPQGARRIKKITEAGSVFKI